MDKDDVNRKFLRSLGEEWTIYTVSFRQGDDLEDKEHEDLYNDLRIFEAKVEKKKRPIGYSHNAALLSSENPSSFRVRLVHWTEWDRTGQDCPVPCLARFRVGLVGTRWNTRWNTPVPPKWVELAGTSTFFPIYPLLLHLPHSSSDTPLFPLFHHQHLTLILTSPPSSLAVDLAADLTARRRPHLSPTTSTLAADLTPLSLDLTLCRRQPRLLSLAGDIVSSLLPATYVSDLLVIPFGEQRMELSETNEDIILEAFLASHVKSSLINDDLDQINANDLEEMDIKWQMAMLTLRMKRFIRRTGRNNFDVKRGDKAGFDKSKVRCYKCNEPGHFARECKGGTTNHQNTGSGSSQAPRFNNRGNNSNPSSSQALVSQEGQGFDWSDHAEEAVQNQALMAEIKESEIPTEVSSKLCSDSCLETVKKYRDHNQTMSDSIKKMEREIRDYVKIIDNLEDQIKAYKANELQFEYDHNYWKWEKKELERKLSKEKEELESARKELSKAKED
ncbi:hypothetical protein OSB04_011183 [Centaurea solstitialis]|uniref:CCHC-type domain-containing protein n=1 Tax=Centaurea solstitialis TaxID=347529 RepID=A0AA38TAN2_9ASTR|nr:hypothetical protein OSB04_011183 [Centaurea solstitialis]